MSGEQADRLHVVAEPAVVGRPWCLAPSVQLYLFPNGDVRPCCRTSEPIGSVADSTLSEIWFGDPRRALIDALGAGTVPHGCGPCAAEVGAEGGELAYPHNFERFGDQVLATPTAALAWPARIEFNLSNRCNLMCIQCNGTLSSAIRARREHLPPLPPVYGDAFFADLEEFVPHLSEAQFAGGEPFIAEENHRVWEMIGRLHPDLRCIVVTNATWWNERIERVATELRMGFTLSIDAVTRETYESIRVNASFDRVMENVQRYVAAARANDMPVEVNFCLMRQNHAELPLVLRWAESLGAKVNVSVVRAPEDCSLAPLPNVELLDVLRAWQEADGSLRADLDLNLSTWDGELARVERWASTEQSARRDLWWSSEWDSNTVTHSSLGLRVLGLPVAPPLVEAERREVLEWARHGQLVEFDVDYDGHRDDDHLITRLVPGAGPLAASLFEDAVGAPPSRLLAIVQEPFGQLLDSELVEETGERTEVRVTFERAEVRMVAVRTHNGRGRLTGATAFCAVLPTVAPVGS